jgi:hypothetical protein
MSNPFATMSQREKILAAIVGGAVFLLFNIILLNVLNRQQLALRSGIASKRTELETMKTLIAERDMWQKRDAWLSGKQPAIGNEGTAQVQLLEHVKKLAGTAGVTLENPVIATPGKSQYYRSVGVNVETKSLWPALVKFLQSLQQPGDCVVIESASVQIDPSDNTRMKGVLKIAKWYKP